MPLNDEERKIVSNIERLLAKVANVTTPASALLDARSYLKELQEPPPVERSKVVFVDTETTGLDPERHEIWECATIEEDGRETVWQLPVDLGRADAIALKIGGFHERRWPSVWGSARNSQAERALAQELTDPRTFAGEFAEITRGCHLVGAVVSFDAQRLDKLLRSNGALAEWHYHLIDVEAMAVGHIAARATAMRQANGEGKDGSDALRAAIGPPWKSVDLSRNVGVDPDNTEFAKHTALGDARWARAMYYAIIGIPAPPSEDQ